MYNNSNKFKLNQCCHFFCSGLTPDFFSLSGDNVGAKRGAGPCDIASVMFTAAMEVQKNTGIDSTNYYCGGQFNIMTGAQQSGVVRCKFYLYVFVGNRKSIQFMTFSISDDIFFSADALPFELRTIVINNGAIFASNVGFNINYRQIAC